MHFSNFCSLDFVVMLSITCGQIRRGSCFQLEANKKKLPISEAPSSAAYFYGMRNIAINLENERREEKREGRGERSGPETH